ncbi:MAG: hypothetical protein O7H41_03645 [Planctomycetota bacterium]|nr:hypothetical protein [Planctomycetota bacterium]
MRKIGILLALLYLAVGCAAIPPPGTPHEVAYVERVMKQSVNFSLANDVAIEAWSRAHDFTARYASKKLQIVSDYAIETYNPTKTKVEFGYSITRVIGGSESTFAVRCFCGNSYHRRTADRNAHILADYMVTGELPFPHLVRR